MAIRNQNWYDLQSTRRYPLDDQSTGVDDAGQHLRDNILVDCHLRFPNTVGRYAYVQGITVAPQLVTIVFGAVTDLTDTSPVSIAAVSLPRSAAQNVNHEVTPLVGGVAGWVVLGSGLAEEFVGRYTTPVQTLLAPKTARAYRPLPIPTIRKAGLATGLQGIVNLSAQSPVVITQEQVFTEDGVAEAFVFSLDTTLTINGQSPLQTYLGPCAQRPESGTCPKPTIKTVNGISPDCDGNINIVLEGLTARRFLNGGVDVISNVGLAETCAAAGGNRVEREAVNNCGNDWADPMDQLTPTITESESIPDYTAAVCPSIPLCINFTAGSSPNFVEVSGHFIYFEQSAPVPCVGAGNTPTYTTHNVAVADKVFQPNIMLHQNCVGSWALNRTISTELCFSHIGAKRNGGIVLNYLTNQAPHNRTTYLLALIDGSRNKVRLLRYTGYTLVEEHSVNFLSGIGIWYRLSVAPVQAGANVLVTVAVEAIGGSVAPVSFSVPVSNYGAAIGQAGLYADSARTFFNHFKVAN